MTIMSRINNSLNPLVILLMVNIIMSSAIMSFLMFSIEVGQEDRQKIIVAGQKRSENLTNQLIATQHNDALILNQIAQANRNSNATVNKVGGFKSILFDINKTASSLDKITGYYNSIISKLKDTGNATAQKIGVANAVENNKILYQILNMLQKQQQPQ